MLQGYWLEKVVFLLSQDRRHRRLVVRWYWWCIKVLICRFVWGVLFSKTLHHGFHYHHHGGDICSQNGSPCAGKIVSTHVWSFWRCFLIFHRQRQYVYTNSMVNYLKTLTDWSRDNLQEKRLSLYEKMINSARTMIIMKTLAFVPRKVCLWKILLVFWVFFFIAEYFPFVTKLAYPMTAR